MNSLVIFYALGIISKIRKLKFMGKVRELMVKCALIKLKEHDMFTIKSREILCNESMIEAYRDRLKKCLKFTWDAIRDFSSESQWLTLLHGDFWVNNIMFHHDENGLVDKIKFIDFQLIQYNLIFSNCDVEVLDKHFDLL